MVDDYLLIFIYFDNWLMLDTIMFELILTSICLVTALFRFGMFIKSSFLNFITKYLICLWYLPYEMSTLWICYLLLLLSSDIQPNAGPGRGERMILFKFLSCVCNISFEFSTFWIFYLLLLLSSDVHPNPGPNYNTNRDFSNGFCNWNLNTLSKDNFNRISLLEAHNTIFNYDIWRGHIMLIQFIG